MKNQILDSDLPELTVEEKTNCTGGDLYSQTINYYVGVFMGYVDRVSSAIAKTKACPGAVGTIPNL